jgi:predicted nucleic acid-binding protein
MPSIFIDANVLYSIFLTDLLLTLAQQTGMGVYWSERVSEEWMSALLEKRLDLKPEERLFQMNQAFPDALVEGYEHLMPTLSLPDPRDVHVLAAAIHCQAERIITFNLRDFPKKTLQPYGLFAQHPDVFLLKMEKALATMEKQREKMQKPQISREQYYQSLLKHQLLQTGAKYKEIFGLV